MGCRAIANSNNEINAAIAEFERILRVEPDNIEVNVRLGSLRAGNGEVSMAAACYEKALSLNPHCGDAHYGLASLQLPGKSSARLQRLEAVWEATGVPDADRIKVGFALGRIYDRRQQYDRAFAVFDEANRLQSETLAYSLREQEAMFKRHTDSLTAEFIDYCRPAQISDSTPILVVGMPRSGTSLVEQILASHPAVHGAGEVEHTRLLAEDVDKMTGKPFPENIQEIAPNKLGELAFDYVQRLKKNTGSAQRVVDKLPHNFLRIGLFAALLPNVRIILCERDPLDNCLSIFQHPFSAGHGYSSDLTDLGEYYRLYEKLISHWSKLLPNFIYRLQYEDLVNDTENQIRKLLDYCDLSFHENCLSFQNTQRYVDSPSSGQVRQAMHSNSIGRASNYKDHLQPLIEALTK